MKTQYIYTKEVLLGDEVMFTGDFVIMQVEEIDRVQTINPANGGLVFRGKQLMGWSNFSVPVTKTVPSEGWKVLLLHREKTDA